MIDSSNSTNPIVSAIDAVADHVEKYADITAWDTSHQPTEEERAARRSGILTVNNKLRALSDAAEVRKISGSEFDALISELYVAHFPGVIREDLIRVHAAIASF
jgi:hypothetical protein